ncbi:hypothetical protein CYMTET_54064 [Cymbomonas tetramitiformis]|uniref:Uncharacterized protein n=1 Tax=Cymbomonas tetramitiformis TaxID=36881 RepID=A0AAE0BFU6_9CHLO|nr:hypothetical protein CYMTET_54064 [Cymbomonas tetramitiformis]
MVDVREMYVMEELYLLPGVYRPATDPMLFIAEGTTLTSITSSHGAGATVLDCEYRSQGLVIESTHTAFSNLTIRNCRGLSDSNADLPAPFNFYVEGHSQLQGSGGAVLVLKGRLQMAHCIIEGGRASAYGGGLAVVGAADAGTVSLKDVLFSNNQGVCGGGALATLCEADTESTSTVIITQSIFRHNLAKAGGAVYATCSLLSVNHSRFEYNSAESLGGAIFSDTEQSVGVSDSIFEHNIASHRLISAAESCPGEQLEWFIGATLHTLDRRSSTRGGAIALLLASLHVSTSRFINCSAELGGALSIMGATPESSMGRREHYIEIESCMLQRNTAGFAGGAVWILDTPTAAPIRMQHVRCADNTAVTGACLSLEGTGVLRVLDTALARNQASTAGGGIAIIGYVSVELSRLRFISNSAGAHGGALSCDGAGLVQNRASWYNNNTAGTGGRGGALSFSDVCSGDLEEIDLTDNAAGKFGGALYSSVLGDRSSLRLHKARFVRNRAKYMGGAMFTEQQRDSMMLVEVSFLENHVEQGGGGAVVSQTVLPCINCTVSGNVAHFAEDFMTTELHLIMLGPYNGSDFHAISGAAMPPFDMQLLDEYDTLIQVGQSEHACDTVMSTEADAAQIEGNVECIQEGVAMFDELKLFALPATSINISITAYAVLPGNLQQVSSAANFTVMLEPCQDSEGLSQDLLVCEVCHTKHGYATSPSERCVLCKEDQTVDGFQCKDQTILTIQTIIIITAISLSTIPCIAALFSLIRANVTQRNLRREEMGRTLDELKFKQREDLIVRSNHTFINHHLKSKFAAVCSALELVLPLRKPDQYDIMAEDDSSDPNISILMSCRKELMDGFEVCNNAQLCEQVMQGMYAVDTVPCNVEALFRGAFQDKLEIHVDTVETWIEIDPSLIQSLIHLAYNDIMRYPGAIPILRLKIVELDDDVMQLHMLLYRTVVQTSEGTMSHVVANLEKMSEDVASLMMQQTCRAMVARLSGEFEFELSDEHIRCNFVACGLRSLPTYALEAAPPHGFSIPVLMNGEWRDDYFQEDQEVDEQIRSADVFIDIDHIKNAAQIQSPTFLDEEPEQTTGLRYAVCEDNRLTLTVLKKFVLKTLRGTLPIPMTPMPTFALQ